MWTDAGWRGSEQRRRHPLHQAVVTTRQGAAPAAPPPPALPSTIAPCQASNGWYHLTTPAGLSSPGQIDLALTAAEALAALLWQGMETCCQKGLGSVVVLLLQMFAFFPP